MKAGLKEIVVYWYFGDALFNKYSLPVCSLGRNNTAYNKTFVADLIERHGRFNGDSFLRFYNGQYQMEQELAQGKHPAGARLIGRYVSTEFAESVIDAKLRLALNPNWLNTKMFEVKLLVPKGTTLDIGTVASVTLPTGSVLPGGAEQVILPKNWPEKWILGYRRVTARQLQMAPHYWQEKPEEVIVGKGGLYSHICPLCGYWKTRNLSTEEQFSIIGVKGTRYTMKNVCLNPDCEYYW